MPEGREPESNLPTPVGRLIAIIVSAGLAWAIVIALVAWIFGFLLSGS